MYSDFQLKVLNEKVLSQVHTMSRNKINKSGEISIFYPWNCISLFSIKKIWDQYAFCAYSSTKFWIFLLSKEKTLNRFLILPHFYKTSSYFMNNFFILKLRYTIFSISYIRMSWLNVVKNGKLFFCSSWKKIRNHSSFRSTKTNDYD